MNIFAQESCASCLVAPLL